MMRDCQKLVPLPSCAVTVYEVQCMYVMLKRNSPNAHEK
jgi:hypothetical protein